MGMFSYICSKTHRAIRSKEKEVVLYLLVKGKVVEIMAGPYSGYGSVDNDEQYMHKILNSQGELVDIAPNADAAYAGEEWLFTNWDSIVGLSFDEDRSNGIHAVIGTYDKDYVPTQRSEDDPNQGWGDDDDEDDECDVCEGPWCGC